MPSITLVDTTSTQTVSGKTLSAPSIVSGVLSGCTATTNPTTALGLATKQYVDAINFGTGDVKLTYKSIADTGWVLMNDGTIGSASSGATTRANADTQALFELLWNNVIDQWVPVVGGRGGSATADFTANKQLRLPRMIGRAIAGSGAAITSVSGVDAGVSTSLDTFTVPANTATWVTGMPVVFTLSSGTITGLTSGNTYYIIRDSSTAVRLATSPTNAQNLVGIDLTAKSSPVWTLTVTITARAIGEYLGEEMHIMNINELPAHTHPFGAVQNAAGTAIAGGTDKGVTTTNTSSTGNVSYMNIMNPTTYLNVMIRL